MLLKLLKGNHLYNYILFPVIGLMLIAGTLLQDGVFYPAFSSSAGPLSFLLQEIEFGNIWAVFTNYLLILLISLLLLHINEYFSMARDATFLPSYLFLFIVYAIPNLQVLQPIFLSALFIALSFRSIFSSIDQKYTVNKAFNAGFFIGIAGLFYTYATLIVLIIPISIYILRNNLNWRNLLSPILGAIFPWLYLLVYYFIFKDIALFFELLEQSFQMPEVSFFSNTIIFVYLSYLILITLIASFFIIKQYDEKKINTRRYYKVLFIYFVSILLLLLIPPVSFEIIVLIALPLTFLITNYLAHMKRRFWAELFFTTLVVISIILQFLH
ncbi:MAG: DUF6427 family protein [Prolixibacteraceae bacterium]|nr:DUF6427 family protein [Prolixibacteraceae bacterium]